MSTTYKFYASFLPPFAFIVALLYSFGFWGAFDVNFMELIPFTDIIKLAAYTLSVSLFFILIGTLIGLYASEPVINKLNNNEELSRFDRFELFFYRKLMPFLMFIVMLMMLYRGMAEGWLFLVYCLVFIL